MYLISVMKIRVSCIDCIVCIVVTTSNILLFLILFLLIVDGRRHTVFCLVHWVNIGTPQNVKPGEMRRKERGEAKDSGTGTHSSARCTPFEKLLVAETPTPLHSTIILCTSINIRFPSAQCQSRVVFDILTRPVACWALRAVAIYHFSISLIEKTLSSSLE